jgi:purine-binding chemotaxis protein CheW
MHKRVKQAEPDDPWLPPVVIPRVDIVVQNYLDSLLVDVALSADRQSSDFSEPVTGTCVDLGGVETEPITYAQTLMEEFNEQPPVLPAVHPSDVLAPGDSEAMNNDVAHFEVPEPESSILLDPRRARVRPSWSERVFASLLFDVNGLSLAAPLHALGGICPIEDKLQVVVGQADWFMGLLRWNDRNIRVVDTARYVMPERVSGRSHQAGYHSVIILGDSNWALAVNSADQSVNFSPEDILWRQAMGKRPWLAGTVLNNLRALLDIEVLLTMLNASEVGTTGHPKDV